MDSIAELQRRLQAEKMSKWNRRVPFGDLVTDRSENAKALGFGEGTTMYDSVLVLGDVKVGSHCWIGPNVILDGSGGLTIGDHVHISAGAQIYSHHTVRRAISMGQEATERASTTIGSGVYIGPNSVIQMGVEIGDRVTIGAMSLVARSIPSNSRAWGCPARISLAHLAPQQ